MSQTFVLAMGLGLLTAVANLVGSLAAVFPRQPSRRFLLVALGFSGAFILSAVVLEIVPESLEATPMAPLFLLLGYLLTYLIEQWASVHVHRLPEPHDAQPSTGVAATSALPAALFPGATVVAALLAFNLHDFIDGLAIGSAFLTGETLGALVFLAVLLHEVPAGFAIAALMRAAGRSRRAGVLAGMSLGLITLLGIVLPFGIGAVVDASVAVLVALAGGSFLYLGASILIPTAEGAFNDAPQSFGRRVLNTAPVLMGILVFFVSDQLLSLFLSE